MPTMKLQGLPLKTLLVPYSRDEQVQQNMASMMKLANLSDGPL